MQPLNSSLDHQWLGDIYRLAEHIQAEVKERWQVVFEETQSEMVAYYPRYGDSIYNLYCKRFFAPLNRELKKAGLKASPKLPGDLKASREWGPETERQRWIWSKISQADKTMLGTILVIFYHNHNRIDLPRPMEIVGLEQYTTKALMTELSKRSPHFNQTPALKSKRPFG